MQLRVTQAVQAVSSRHFEIASYIFCIIHVGYTIKMKYLIGVDGSEHSKVAVQSAVRLSRPGKDEVSELIYVPLVWSLLIL